MKCPECDKQNVTIAYTCMDCGLTWGRAAIAAEPVPPAAPNNVRDAICPNIVDAVLDYFSFQTGCFCNCNSVLQMEFRRDLIRVVAGKLAPVA